ncbi:multidrug resistance efflux transporter family protein [Hominiventricola filiformis]|uniref:Multidrug resistance efflux transporter family protein n=1 Tax=Hominiventricola filiformis TaxID=2885352 RepID=A0AAE3DCB0_9FIRM|nr:multidrug resistance efflux transporter family protein [Hominiventricola filiformis]
MYEENYFFRNSGMTLCSMPFWLVICFLALSSHSLPSCGQTVQYHRLCQNRTHRGRHGNQQFRSCQLNKKQPFSMIGSY